MEQEIIKQLGLKEKEARLYSACLELGPSKAKDLSKLTDLNRGTIYDVARSLFKKGLLSSTQRKNTTYFVANNPRTYIQKIEENLNSAKKALPALELLLQSSSYRPKLRYFEGNEGIKNVYEEILNTKDKMIYCLSSPQEMFGSVGADFMREYVKRRARRHIHMKAINDPKGDVDDRKYSHSTHSDAKLLRETKIGPENLRIPGMIEIYDNSVAMMSTKKENFGFIIESEEFATLMKQMFEILWSQSTDDIVYLKKQKKSSWRQPIKK